MERLFRGGMMPDGTPVEMSIEYQRERGDILAYECQQLTKERNEMVARLGRAQGDAAYWRAKAEYLEKMFDLLVRDFTGFDAVAWRAAAGKDAKAEAARFTREEAHDDGA